MTSDHRGSGAVEMTYIDGSWCRRHWVGLVILIGQSTEQFDKDFNLIEISPVLQ